MSPTNQSLCVALIASDQITSCRAPFKCAPKLACILLVDD
ncbi:hypothetical protein SLEP1_g18900 [Rubroshorea leprosula]|uniref:Uncharacterized protein n=1 Tax=Rubroshorea leprosula TaxID=152421 RepID=A0AAV5IZ30_9ROSI|nr:hypothetical protein SLEP1_g18900 [Rubroshorea leprosula]